MFSAPHVIGRPQLSNTERTILAEIAKRLGRKHLAEVACLAKPDTILARMASGGVNPTAGEKVYVASALHAR